ncbi:hypothetical protein O0L34_g13151 [Tuta absoluta]|nr:hypothetical protein O0L34_g13151 [Tuta absoluta]
MSQKAIYLSIKRNFDFFFGDVNNSKEPISDKDTTMDNTITINNQEASQKNYEKIKESGKDDKMTEESETDDEMTEESETDDEMTDETRSVSSENSYEEKRKKIDGNKGNREFTFYLDVYQWQKIQPITKIINLNKKSRSILYQNRMVLPKHAWAHVLRQEIWKSSKLTCSWIFKTHSIINDETIKCYGACNKCTGKIKIIIYWPTEKIAKCDCIVTDNEESCTPKKKIKLSPAKRQELAEDLKHESAIIVKNKLSASTMVPGDIEPPHVPTVGALRQIKHEANKCEYFDSNPITSLWIMALTSYKDLIRQIFLYPVFYVFYWSLPQVQYYAKYAESNRTLLSVDATGSIFKKFGPTSKIEATQHIFLYMCLLATDKNERSVPVTQMVSESHTIDTIEKWLQAWVQGKKTPNEVVMDDAAALIGAAVKAFTEFDSTKEYVKDSFSKLDKGLKTPDACYIRIDTSHFVKIIYNLNCFKNKDVRIKFFFCHCLLHIKKNTNFDEVKQHIADIITVCLNEYDDPNSRCGQAKTRLKQLLSAATKSNDDSIVSGISAEEGDINNKISIF